MSAKKSWDIQPGRRAIAEAPAKKLVRASAKPAASNLPLRARRKRARNRLLFIALAILALGASSVVYGLHRPEVRVQVVEAAGMHEAKIPNVALEALQGSYMGVVPRDSVFFYPEEAVRAAVLGAFPDISSVSISWTGFSSIRVTAHPRALAFSWCGSSIAEAALGVCYEADGEGFIYGPSTSASTTLKIYAPLGRGGANPIGSMVEAARHVPLALQLVRAIEALGVSIGAVELRGDEADLYARGSNTRITYLLGEESKAASLAATVVPTLSLTDGSIEYLDLRFEGKAYLRRRGEPASEGE